MCIQARFGGWIENSWDQADSPDMPGAQNVCPGPSLEVESCPGRTQRLERHTASENRSTAGNWGWYRQTSIWELTIPDQNVVRPGEWIWCRWARNRPAYHQHYYSYWKVSTVFQANIVLILWFRVVFKNHLQHLSRLHQEMWKWIWTVPRPIKMSVLVIYSTSHISQWKNNEPLFRTEIGKYMNLPSSCHSSPWLHPLWHSKTNIATDSNP